MDITGERVGEGATRLALCPLTPALSPQPCPH